MVHPSYLADSLCSARVPSSIPFSPSRVNMAARPALVLWIRHCESCSNVAQTARKKFLEAPLCTERGMQQSLLIALRIRSLLESRGLTHATVRFYCSYLPRAMLTAALAASAWAALEGIKARVPVQVLCHIGELANPLEEVKTPDARADAHVAPACVSRSTESVSTARDSRCWAREINRELKSAGREAGRAAFRARIRWSLSTDCSEGVSCAPPDAPSWGSRSDDYAWFLRNIVPRWVQEAAADSAAPPVVHVVVSHGAYIQTSLFPHAPEGSRRLDNTDMVFVRYLSSNGASAPPELLESPVPLPDLPAWLESMRQTAVGTLWPDSCSLSSDAHWQRCRAPWSKRGAREPSAPQHEDA